MFSREYLFNPFKLQTSTDDELSDVISSLADLYKRGDDPYDVAFNINLESDMLMVYGEFIARLQEEYSLTKLEADNMVAKAIYQLRNEWKRQNDEKAPAISYFEAMAEDMAKELRSKQYKDEAMLTRFKKAYNSLETKQNALKKKLEAMRYEEI